MGAEQGAESLLHAIDERAEQERARLVAEAEKKAREILAAAETDVEALVAEARASLELEREAARRRLVGEAVMRVRAEGLGRRRDLLDQAFAQARGRLERMRRGPEGRAALEALAREARAAVGEPCTMEVSEEDGRVIALSGDGRRRVDNGLETRLRRLEATAEHVVARWLFGPPGGEAE